MAKAKFRNRAGRFIKGTARRARRASKKLFNLGRGTQQAGVMGALQHPISRMVAPAIGVAAVAELFFTPINNGQSLDSWAQRLVAGYATYKQSGNPTDLLAQDTEGNNAITLFVAQVKQNALPAAATGLLAAVVGWAGRKVGA